ncbi:rhomboid family intramembrane serine protease [Rhodococcus coprophilus]|uniref:Serine peptidase n=1 Tax=Rhodococcus coprophilus TaxID=38310 RepID=A0A2X4WRJ9_9NOCA|nr:rhomboid family intramembrane serine protease [Rhodococcus coprophilus]MBM7457363.1 membrane associated rhomboid family serine protease [Rhodococcus coprophilus]SQI29585.1 serine peptidase [Rhodococcus coprophilus]
MTIPTGNGTGSTHRPIWQRAALWTGGFLVLLYGIEAADTVLPADLDAAGVEPRTGDGLWGILFAPLLHADWAHLTANTVPALVLGFLVMLSGIGRGIAATAIIWLVGGIGTWLFAGTGENHIGASTLIFGWLTYLIVRGIFTRKAGQILLGIVVLFVYGGMLWGVLPSQPWISWQGHLFGALGGILAAWVLSSGARATRRTTTAPSLR